MIIFDEYLKNIKVGDTLTIEKNPYCWASDAGGVCGWIEVSFPYTFTINEFIIITPNIRFGPSIYIAVKDTNGYGWCIKWENQKLFNFEKNRKSRIENLEL